MLERFLDFVTKNELFSSDTRLLVAISGGVDSVVLSDLLRRGEFDFALVHCNFKLRDEESEEDENFVRALADAMKVSCFVRTFDTKKYAKEQGVSIQMAARELRYGYFRELQKKQAFDVICTAHHLNDSLETALFNFTKGTGVAGLRGILPKSEQIVRPLLFATKEEVLDYAKARQLSWCEDSSNASSKYSRNQLRNEVMPILKQINPALEQTFVSTAQRLASLERLLKNRVTSFLDTWQQEGNHQKIEIEALQHTELVVVEEALKKHGFNHDQVIELIQALKSPVSGKIWQSATHQLNVDRSCVYLSPIHTENFEVEIKTDDQIMGFPGGKLSFHSTKTWQITPERKWAYLDKKKLKFPLKLRLWQEGDSFVPLGMRGKKKLSDFMIDEKIPLNLKSSTYVLTSENQIVWVVGQRIDDRFKLTPNTTSAYIIQLSDD